MREFIGRAINALGVAMGIVCCAGGIVALLLALLVGVAFLGDPPIVGNWPAVWFASAVLAGITGFVLVWLGAAIEG